VPTDVQKDMNMNESIGWTIYESPLGPLVLLAGPRGLRELRFPGEGGPLDEALHRPAALSTAVAQLEEYFAGERTAFDLPLDPGGSAFERLVWRRLLEIPHGSTITYGRLAEDVGRPDIVRAVGGAVGRTPVPIVIPCHRVIGADGGLRGYRGGLQRKRALLDLELGVGGGPGWAKRQLALL
jgi:methylated-DNA-[protein]-cysteine S-methyltransferase